jgi:RPA family protein
MSSDDGGGPGRREVAYRLFATEFEDSDFSYAESDEERAPNYVVTPTGARINRLYIVGVLTEVEPVSNDVLRARVVDPTGAFVLYAGQYQPDQLAFLESADPPAFVAVTGKARTFEPDDSDQVFTSVRPESMNVVDAETRDRWTVDAAEDTLERVETMAAAMASDVDREHLADSLEAGGVRPGLAAGIPLALEHYGTTPTYLAAVRDLAFDAARVVAGERDEVAGLDATPDAEGSASAATLADSALSLEPPADAGEPAAAESGPSPASPAEPESRTGSQGARSEVDQPATEPDQPSTDGTTEGLAESVTETAPASTTDEAPAEEPSAGDTTGGAAEAEPATVAETGPAEDEPATRDEAEPGDETAAPEEAAAPEESAAPDETATPDAAAEPAAEGGVGDFDGEEFELDEDEREELESEYGTEFQSGTEVDEPGSADIDTEGMAAPASDVDETSTDAQSATAAADESAAGADESAEDADEESEDLEDQVMATMEALDEGDGAPRDDLLERVVDEAGADPSAVEDAIQDALMDGRCYEPDDETLKPI